MKHNIIYQPGQDVLGKILRDVLFGGEKKRETSRGTPDRDARKSGEKPAKDKIAAVLAAAREEARQAMAAARSEEERERVRLGIAESIRELQRELHRADVALDELLEEIGRE